MKTHRNEAALAIAGLLAMTLACGTIGEVISNQPAVQTVEAVASQADELGNLAETAQAVATEVDDSGLVETAEALATDVGDSGLVETAEAVATDVGLDLGEAPADIPLLDADPNGLVATSALVTYTTARTADEVKAFYETELPANGWVLSEGTAYEFGDLYTVTYTKDGRSALLNITAATDGGATLVSIVITGS
jgi:hypothetical protein